MMPYITTFTGRTIAPFTPELDDLVIEDIAHALAMQCRFGGHTRDFYSVAQHCVLASTFCEGEAPDAALWLLLHDASEAYLVDIPRPVKRSALMGVYRHAESQVQRAIYAKFGLQGDPPPIVAEVDERLAMTEARDLLLRPGQPAPDWWNLSRCYRDPIEPWEPKLAEWQFLRRFRDLTAARQGVAMKKMAEM